MSTGTPGTLRLWAATAAVSVAALVLGLVGYHGYVGSPAAAGPAFAASGPFDLLYYTLQLFVLGASPFGGPPYGVPLSLAMYLAPLATVLAVVATVSAAFRERLAAWRVSRRTGHDVVVGRTPEAFALAQRLAASTRNAGTRDGKRTVVLLGTDVPAGVARRHDIHVVAADTVDEEALRAAGVPGAARVFALAGSGATNAAVALHVRALHENVSPDRDIAVHARVDDAELVAAMRARRLGVEGDRGFRVDFFSIETIAAIALLDEFQPGPGSAVVGSDVFAVTVRRELERRLRQALRPSWVPLVPCEKAAGLTARSGVTFVCTRDADEVLRVGLNLLLTGHRHVVLCLGRRAALAGALEQTLFDRVGGRLSVFGMLDAACDPDRVTGNALIEKLARALHADYRRNYGDSRQASDVEWDLLEDRFKDDNREQADDVGRKLGTLPAIIVAAAAGLPEFSLTDAEVERLAEMEHVRWMEDKQRDGIVYGPKRTSSTHPDMLEWSDPRLTEATKDKDRMFVRNLPDLLAAEDLAIVRRAGS